MSKDGSDGDEEGWEDGALSFLLKAIYEEQWDYRIALTKYLLDAEMHNKVLFYFELFVDFMLKATMDIERVGM
jgi:hypothetical protein